MDKLKLHVKALSNFPRAGRPLIWLCDEHGNRTTPKKVLTRQANVVFFPGEVKDTLSTVIAVEMPACKPYYRSIVRDTVRGVRPQRDGSGQFVGNITVQF